jgi:hypothetical protein
MISRGIDGAIVAWYGPDDSVGNRSTQLFFAEAAKHPGFSVAISIDTGAFQNCDRGHCDNTDEMIRLLHYVEDHFESSPAYLRVNGRPLVTSFGLESRDIQWDRVRSAARNNPLFIFRNSVGFKHPESDGAFSWVAPETATASDPVGSSYLNRFNSTGLASGGKLIIASAFKGFNDSAASWGKGKSIQQNCGETWLNTFDIINRTYSSHRQLPFLLIPTWNDYEEGTEIESGIDNCLQLQASLRSNSLTWDVTGFTPSVDHYAIFASSDGKNLSHVDDVPSQSRSFDLKRAQLPVGTKYLYVQAVGKPSIQNHLSEPIAFRASRESR